MRYILMVLALLIGATTALVSTAVAAEHTQNPILLNTERNGDLWFVQDGMRYSLRTAADTRTMLSAVALGITNNHIATIPLALTNSSGVDTDNDGLADRFEDAIGSDKNNPDTDGDGYVDRVEIENGFAVLGEGSVDTNMTLAKRLAGHILLQVEQNGEAWYVHPTTYERHYLGSAEETRSLFATLAQGANQATLNEFTIANSIADIAINTDSVSTLVQAVVAADLVETLQSDGPFTVFAPTNEAFAALPEDQLAALLADKEALTDVLTYHVVPGYYPAASVLNTNSLPTVQGQVIVVDPDQVRVNQAQIIATDIRAGNGIIHLIDGVITPTDNVNQETAMTSIIDVASESGNFTTLLTAIEAADLTAILESDGPFTVFAPTNEAFAALPEDQLEALLADKEALAEVLTYHVVPGAVLAEDVISLSSATTVQGSDVSVSVDDAVMIDNATVVATDILADNGVIHVIDTVLIP